MTYVVLWAEYLARNTFDPSRRKWRLGEVWESGGYCFGCGDAW